MLDVICDSDLLVGPQAAKNVPKYKISSSSGTGQLQPLNESLNSRILRNISLIAGQTAPMSD
jgi:hypothetical protein